MLWGSIAFFFSIEVFVFIFHSIVVFIYPVRSLKYRSRAFTFAEITITVALAANATTIGLTATATRGGFGTHMSAIPEPGDRITIYLLAAWIVGGVASGCARISIASTTFGLIYAGSAWKLAFICVAIGCHIAATIAGYKG